MPIKHSLKFIHDHNYNTTATNIGRRRRLSHLFPTLHHRNTHFFWHSHDAWNFGCHFKWQSKHRRSDWKIRRVSNITKEILELKLLKWELKREKKWHFDSNHYILICVTINNNVNLQNTAHSKQKNGEFIVTLMMGWNYSAKTYKHIQSCLNLVML